jgi:DNA invertase Pin-like site-specific DNA recombinase
MSRIGRRCTVCDHEQHLEIDKALIRGVTRRRVARLFGLGRTAVWRHYENGHISKQIAQGIRLRQAKDWKERLRIMME